MWHNNDIFRGKNVYCEIELYEDDAPYNLTIQSLDPDHIVHESWHETKAECRRKSNAILFGRDLPSVPTD